MEPDEIERMKRRLAMLGQIEQGGMDISALSPSDDKGGALLDAMPQSAGPVSRAPLMQPRTVTVAAGGMMPASPVAAPAAVQVAPEAGIRDLELEGAKALDSEARQRRLFEAATRQLIGGLTRRAPAPVLTQETTAEKDLLAQRRQKRLDALAELESGAKLEDIQKRRETAAADLARREQQRKEDLEYRARQEDRSERGLKASMENAAATRALAGANLGIRREEVQQKEKERTDKAAAGSMPFMGGTFTLKQGLTDTEAGQGRTKASLWEAADRAVGNFQTELEAMARNPSVEAKGRVTAALRTASSAFNSAIGGGAMSMDEAKAMSDAMGADLLTPTGVQAFVQSFSGNDAEAAKTITNRVRAARKANRAAASGLLSAYGEISGGGEQSAQPPQGGMVTVRRKRDGATKTVPAAQAAKILQSPDYEEVR